MKRGFGFLAPAKGAVWRNGGSLSHELRKPLESCTIRTTPLSGPTFIYRFCTQSRSRELFFTTSNGVPLNTAQLSNIINNLETKGASIGKVQHQTLHASHLALLFPLTVALPDLRKRLAALVPLVNIGDKENRNRLLSSLAPLSPEILDCMLTKWSEQTNKKELFSELWHDLPECTNDQAKESCLHILLRHLVSMKEKKGVLFVLEEMRNMKIGVEQSMGKNLTSLLTRIEEQEEGTTYPSKPEDYIALAKQATTQPPMALCQEAVATSDLQKLKSLLPNRTSYYIAQPLLPAARQVLTEAIKTQDVALQQKAIAVLAWLTAICAEPKVPSLAAFQVTRLLSVDSLTAFYLFKELNALVPSIKFPPKTINSLFWRLKRNHLDEAMQIITTNLGTNVFEHNELESFIQDLIVRKQKNALVTFLESAMKAEQHNHSHKFAMWDTAVRVIASTGKPKTTTTERNEGEGEEQKNDTKELLKRLFWAAEQSQVSLSSLLSVWQALKEKGYLQECDKETVALLKGYCKYNDLSKAIYIKRAYDDSGYALPSEAFNLLLSLCNQQNSLAIGKQLLEQMKACGIQPDSSLDSFTRKLQQASTPTTTPPTTTTTTTTYDSSPTRKPKSYEPPAAISVHVRVPQKKPESSSTKPSSMPKLSEPLIPPPQQQKPQKPQQPSPSLESVHSLREELSEALKKSDTQAALQIVERAFKDHIYLPTTNLSSLLILCADSNNLADGKKLMQLLLQNKTLPTNFAFNKVLSLLGKHGEIDEAFEFLATAHKHGYKMNSAPYTFLAFGLTTAAPEHQMGAASRILAEIDKHRCSLSSSPNTVIHLSHLYTTEGKTEELERLLTRCESNNFVPDRSCYTRLLKAYLRKDDLKSAIEVHKKMKRHKETFPDLVSYMNLFGGLKRLGGNDRVGQLFEEMIEAKVKPDNAIVEIALKSCFALKGVTAFDMALRILTRTLPHLTPPSNTMSTFFQLAIRTGGAEDALELCKKQFANVPMKEDALGVLLRFFLNQENKTKADEVMQLMTDRGITPSSTDLVLYGNLQGVTTPNNVKKPSSKPRVFK